jgi:hypothetical protein
MTDLRALLGTSNVTLEVNPELAKKLLGESALSNLR